MDAPAFDAKKIVRIIVSLFVFGLAYNSDAWSCPSGASCVPYQTTATYTWVGTGISSATQAGLNAAALAVYSKIQLPNGNSYTAFAFGTQIDATHWTFCSWTAQFFNYCGGTVEYTVKNTCPAGYSDNGTECQSACPIADLTPLTDPIAIDFDANTSNRWRPDGLTLGFQVKLLCVEIGITAAGGSYVGTSAYRPTQYQRHLYEIVQKDGQLDPAYMAAHPECQALRDTITQEMGPEPRGHALHPGQAVAVPGKSRHESGTAFDLTPSGLTNAQLAPIYAVCGVSHTAVRGEPWHTQ